MTVAAAVVVGGAIGGPLLLLADGATVHLPAALPTAGAVVLVLSAAALVARYIVRPIYRGACFVRDRLSEVSSLVEQVRDVVQYIGLFGGDVEARLDRIEKALGLGYYRHRRGDDKPPMPVPPALLERLRTQNAIRDLGREDDD